MQWCLIAEVSSSMKSAKNNGDNGHSCLIPMFMLNDLDFCVHLRLQMQNINLFDEVGVKNSTQKVALLASSFSLSENN